MSPHTTLFELDIALLCQDIAAIARKNHLSRVEVLTAVESMLLNDARLCRAQTRLIEYSSGNRFQEGLYGIKKV
jgi:hypothetical protein